MARVPIILSLDTYISNLKSGADTSAAKLAVIDEINSEDRPSVFEEIASNIWDDYSIVEADLSIQILRKWLKLNPENREAKRTLGSYLLCHGPDWDQEGRQLIEEVQ